MSHFEITVVVFVHCNIVNNDNQQDRRVLYTFICTKPFGQLLDISYKNIITFLKGFNPEASYIEVRFTDQSSKLPEIKGKKKITLVIN